MDEPELSLVFSCPVAAVVPTVVGVSDTVLEDGVPLELLLLRPHAEVVVVSIRVPQDQGELGGTLQERGAACFGLHTWNAHACKNTYELNRLDFTNRMGPIATGALFRA